MAPATAHFLIAEDCLELAVCAISSNHSQYGFAIAGNANSLPPLSEQQLLKLRQLTVISIAESKKVLSSLPWRTSQAVQPKS